MFYYHQLFVTGSSTKFTKCTLSVFCQDFRSMLPPKKWGQTHKLIISFFSYFPSLLLFFRLNTDKEQLYPWGIHQSEKRRQTSNMTLRHETLKLYCHGLSVPTIWHSFHTTIYPWACLIAFWQCESYYWWTTWLGQCYCWLHPSVQGDRKKGRKRIVSYIACNYRTTVVILLFA